MGRHHGDERDIDTLNENLSSLDVANMTSTSSFRTTTTLSTSSGGHDSLHDHDDHDDTPSHNTKDSKFSHDPTYDDKTTAAEQQGSFFVTTPWGKKGEFCVCDLEC